MKNPYDLLARLGRASTKKFHPEVARGQLAQATEKGTFQLVDRLEEPSGYVRPLLALGSGELFAPGSGTRKNGTSWDSTTPLEPLFRLSP